MAVKRKCVCCGKEYSFCPNCAKANQPQWMVTFCSEGCKDLFHVISGYNMKRLGKADVQAFIAEHNITGTKYTEPIRKVIDEVVIKAAPMKRIEEDIVIQDKQPESVIRFNQTNQSEETPEKDVVIPMHKNDMESRSWSRRKKRRHR